MTEMVLLSADDTRVVLAGEATKLAVEPAPTAVFVPADVDPPLLLPDGTANALPEGYNLTV